MGKEGLKSTEVTKLLVLNQWILKEKLFKRRWAVKIGQDACIFPSMIVYFCKDSLFLQILCGTEVKGS